ncbi:hypothetical protein LJ737_14270 [Hymenobacter sp. 15J16-1T3B]|uniref:hypothetical protein n=1 Tax=Hymenobacter sp. 15J16-1T3B TaxID=2886941 RepID=UPI001D11C2C7|nr:hypothetical protein [Hymenobacter sp. 15J16-1T3B]MCC3158411.1 hypothetical protein [Hymenobacter sp. 15J16-1T3B]
MRQNWWRPTALIVLAGSLSAQAQTTPPPNTDTQAAQAAPVPPQATTPAFVPLKDGKLPLSEDGSRYVKLTLLNQAWLHYNQSNPGSRVNGRNEPHTLDAAIRRFRIQFYGQLTDRVFIYSQIGINNFGYLSERKQFFFLHDAVGEYAVAKTRLSLGTGLGAWNGLSRFTASSTASILGLDLPLVAETTNDVNDQFGRKLSVYAKGKLGKLDYRVAVSKPLIVAPNTPPVGVAAFSSLAPRAQFQGYFQWQFLDQESNLTPYAAGTYLGKKRVFNLGAGFIMQPKALWYRPGPIGGFATGPDTVQVALKQFAVDAYYDAPVGPADKGQALSAYAAFYHLDYGPNYTRNTAPLSPTNGIAPGTATLNNGGNGWPAYGTGNVLYGQLGYKLPDNLLGSTTFLPYVSVQHARYKRLNDPMNYVDVGLNWLLAGHTSKLTVAYQNRPIFTPDGTGHYNRTSDRSAVVAQYQVSFN